MKPANGTWSRTRDFLARNHPKAFSVRDIAEAINADYPEVRSILYAQAKRGKTVRVITVEPGPVCWRLVKEGA